MILRQIWPLLLLPLVVAYVNWVVIPSRKGNLRKSSAMSTWAIRQELATMAVAIPKRSISTKYQTATDATPNTREQDHADECDNQLKLAIPLPISGGARNLAENMAVVCKWPLLTVLTFQSF
jgi:hypothetical protein